MRNPDMQSGIGEGVSPVQEAKAAMNGFVSDFKSFRNEIHKRLQQQDEKMTKLDRKMINARAPLSASAELDVPHQKAFAAYLRSGDDDGLRGLELEGKAMSSAVAADGGYLVDPATSQQISTVLKNTASIRAVANVVQVESASFDVLIDRGEMATGWATETDATAETATPVIERVSIPLHELSAMPRASQRLLDDSAFDIEGWLARRIADKFARSEATAFVKGDGVNKPKGFLSEAMIDNDDWAWGSIGYVATGVAGDFPAVNKADVIIDLIYALGAEYRASAVFVMNSKTAGELRKMKDNDGRFLWSDSLRTDEFARLMGYKVMICEDMPDVETDAAAIAFGDFSAGYTIAERPDMRVLRDPFSAKPNVLFYANKRVGGGVSDFAAIKVLKFSVA